MRDLVIEILFIYLFILPRTESVSVIPNKKNDYRLPDRHRSPEAGVLVLRLKSGESFGCV